MSRNSSKDLPSRIDATAGAGTGRPKTQMRSIHDTLLGKFLYKTLFAGRAFEFWQNLGFHTFPNLFYSPIPDTRALNSDLWSGESQLCGVNMNEVQQFKLLDLFASRFKNEYEQLPRDKTQIPYQYYINNEKFESVDGEIYYSIIRHFKPRRVFEIGAGNSTYLAAQAILRNQQDDRGYRCDLVAIDPYPNEVLRVGFPGLTELISKRVQDIPVGRFACLQENDILFIDSSHVLKTGGDVQYEYLEILPRVSKGVVVHAHDIFLPAEYLKEWVIAEHRFCTEQYLLHAFLLFNDSFETLWVSSYMHLKHPAKLEEAFGSYNRRERWPRSFWMRRTK